MNYQELKEQIEQAPATSRKDLDLLLHLTTIGDGALPQYRDYLAQASTYREFFDAIYDDDSQKHTQVWAEWAKAARKNWLGRFDPHFAIQGLRLKSDGIPLEFGTGIVLAPTGSRDNVANLVVFKSGAFNAQAAQFVTSVGGSFSCAGYDFVGVYGIYHCRGTVIFEEWQVERQPVVSEKQ